MGGGVQKTYDRIREVIPFQPGDTWWAPEIELVKDMVIEGDLSLMESRID
jgi:histidine ammonia-lyase